MPEIEILKMGPDHGVIMISSTTPEFVNALRRAMISEVPKMAIHEVEFHLGSIRDQTGKSQESMTPMFDEVLAHRLALLPIPTNLDMFEPRDGCSCGGEGCPKCSLMYTLNKRGPAMVYSGDLEPIGGSEYRINPDLIPLVELGEDQAVLIYATAIMGTGKEHSKWQSAFATGMKYHPIVNVDDKLCIGCGKCVELCPREVLEINKGKARVRKGKIIDCTMCGACSEICVEEGVGAGKDAKDVVAAISVDGDQTRFILRYETDGSHTASEILKRALDILVNKYESMREKLSDVL